MRPGFLLIETREDRPSRVRIRTTSQPPSTDERSEGVSGASPRCRYVAHFDDIDAALMHVHNAMRRTLIDPDRRLYRADVRDAVAATEAVALPHRRVHLDPTLARDSGLAARIADRRARHHRDEQIWNAVGALGLVILLGLLLLGF